MANEIKPYNYAVIHGWMVMDSDKGGLGLKGNDLLVYAIIYGFSQVNGNYFNGSMEYLAQWVNCTRVGVIKNVDNLLKMGLIKKINSTPSNLYYATDVSKILCQLSIHKGVNSVDNDCKLSLHNNINIEKEKESIAEIISYLNKVTGSRFKTDDSKVNKNITNRLRSGFTVDDFKKVIDCKYVEWGVAPFKIHNKLSSEFLKPSTLFGEKFENYLFEADVRSNSESTFVRPGYASISEPSNKAVSDIVY